MSKNNLSTSRRKKIGLLVGLSALIIGQSLGIVASHAEVTHVEHCKISNPGVSTKIVAKIYQIHIDTYVPKENFCFFVPASSNGNYGSSDSAVTSVQNLDHAVAIHYTQPILLPLTASDTPLATITSPTGLRTIQIYGLPANFPKISTIGDNSAISKMNLLTTPVYHGVYYAIALQAGQVAFWTQGKYTIETLRQLNQTQSALSPGDYAYAYLAATAPTGSYGIGTWHFLNSSFQEVAQLP